MRSHKTIRLNTENIHELSFDLVTALLFIRYNQFEISRDEAKREQIEKEIKDLQGLLKAPDLHQETIHAIKNKLFIRESRLIPLQDLQEEKEIRGIVEKHLLRMQNELSKFAEKRP